MSEPTSAEPPAISDPAAGKPAPKPAQFSTRLLLSAAAIGVVGGIFALGGSWLFLLLVTAAPWLGTLSSGFYWVPAVLAQALLRRPGVGLIASTVAGLITIPLTAYGLVGALPFIAIGLFTEIVFAVLGYRRWTPAVFYLSAVVSAVLYAFVWIAFFNSDGLPLWQLALMPVLMSVATVAATAAILPLAEKVAQTGAVRGIRGPVRKSDTAGDGRSL